MGSNRVAIVTGAGARGDEIGNGRAAALLLARAGSTLVVVDRQSEPGKRTVELIEAEGGEAALFTADVTAEDDCAGLAEFAAERFGRIDVLVNNVGVGSRGSVTETDLSSWNKVMNINVTSMYLTCRHVIPVMAEGGGGAIVNIGSISALRPRGLTAYSTSKGAVVALTAALAMDHAADGIRANAVVPGPVFTPMVDGPTMTPELRDRRRRASPLKVEGTGWDVGHAVAFLASDQARYITGQSLIVDGGVTLTSPSR